MPYKSNAELPQAVRTALPDEAQSIFRKAFNAIASKNPSASDQRVFKQAWGAVSNAGWHAPESGSGKWIKDAIGCTVDGVQHAPGCGACDSGSNADCTCGAMDSEDEALDIEPPPPAPIPRKRRKPPAYDESPGKLWAFERIALDADAKPRKTADGYLIAFPRIARSGIQLYAGWECGRPSMDQVRVYRPSDEVFSRDSLHSYAHKPVTNDHPPEMVTAANWSEYGVGDIGEEVVRDGEFVRVPMRLMDQQAIDDYESGKVEMSLGYTMNLEWQAGTTDSGEQYDAVQSHIRANHLALVDSARGGPALRIGDSYPGRGAPPMTTKQITVDGLKVTLDERDADIVLRALDKFAADTKALQKQIDELNAALKASGEQTGAAKKDSDVKDAKIATLEKQLKDAEVTPAKLQQLAKDRALVIAKAKTLIGDKVDESKTDAEIMRQAVDLLMGQAAKDWSEDGVKASFESFAARAPAGGGGNQLDNVLRDGLQLPSNFREARDKAYFDMLQRDESAWKMEPGKAN